MNQSGCVDSSAVRTTLRRDKGWAAFLPVGYQVEVYKSLLELWPAPGAAVLDVGCGLGLLADGFSTFLGARRVVGVDVANRFVPDLNFPCVRFDGSTLPFSDGSFDVITIVNVLHHVSPLSRHLLIAECARVSNGGPILLKDHACSRRGDRILLMFLDALGNAPYGGMVKAWYLSDEDYAALFEGAGYSESMRRTGPFRVGIAESLFPSRLEVTIRFDRSSPL